MAGSLQRVQSMTCTTFISPLQTPPAHAKNASYMKAKLPSICPVIMLDKFDIRLEMSLLSAWFVFVSDTSARACFIFSPRQTPTAASSALSNSAEPSLKVVSEPVESTPNALSSLHCITFQRTIGMYTTPMFICTMSSTNAVVDMVVIACVRASLDSSIVVSV